MVAPLRGQEPSYYLVGVRRLMKGGALLWVAGRNLGSAAQAAVFVLFGWIDHIVGYAKR